MVVFCIETFPDIDIEHHHLAGESRDRSGSSMDSDLGNLFFIESICVGWFIFEFIIRFLSCPSRTEFMSQLMNIIDFIAIIPYFLVTGKSTVTKPKLKITCSYRNFIACAGNTGFARDHVATPNGHLHSLSENSKERYTV